MKILLRWLLYAAALIVLTSIYSGVQVQGFGSAMLAALVIGLLNIIVRPVLVILTLPVTLLTLGLFLLVINGLTFWMVSGLLSSFHVTSFGAAMLGALIYSLLGLLIERFITQLFPQ